MEVLKVVEKSLAIPPIVVPNHVLKSLEQKMKDYQESMAGQGPTPMRTRDQSDEEKAVRQRWNLAFKKWGNIAKNLKNKDGVALKQVKDFLEGDALKDFEKAWGEFPHKNPKSIDPSGDELKLVQDYESEETKRLEQAGNLEKAKKDVEQLKSDIGKNYSKEAYKELMTLATKEQLIERDTLSLELKKALAEGKEDWIVGRGLYERLSKLLDTLQDTKVFGAQRKENRDSFAQRLDKLGKAVDQLAPGKALEKKELEERKTKMRDRLNVLGKLFEKNKSDPTWEPKAGELKEMMALWNEVYQCRNDTGEVTEKEPGITVVHGSKIAGSKNKWKAWADKVQEIDDAFTSGLLGFSPEMKLTGNPGCRFHQQGRYWKFYLDEAEMGGSTTMRGWYLPEKLDKGFKVTFMAISDSHGSTTEKLLYGET